MEKGNINLKIFITQSAIVAIALLLLSFLSINGTSLIEIKGIFTAIIAAAAVGLANGLINPICSSFNVANDFWIKALVTLIVNALLLLLMWAIFRYNFYLGGFFRFILTLLLISAVSMVTSYFVKSK